MTENEYILAWLFYIGASAVFFSVFWFWTRKLLWSDARQLMRVVLLVILVVPWYTDANQSYLSPAWLVCMAELLLDGPNAFWRAGMPLTVSLIIAVFISTSYSMYRWFRHRKSEPHTAAD